MKTGELLAHMSNIEVGRYFGLMERLLPFMNPENCGTMFDVMRASILASRELVRPEISRKCYCFAYPMQIYPFLTDRNFQGTIYLLIYIYILFVFLKIAL